MKNNIYTKSIQNTKAPQSLIENAIEYIREEDNKVITAEKSKRPAWNFIGIIAAMLALIIGLSVIPFNRNKPDSEHNFVITAGAAEINPDVFVEVGELQSSGGGSGFKAIEENEDNDFGMDGTYHVIRVDRIFTPQNFDIRGENIESITYTACNCRIAYDTKYAGLVDVEEIPEEEMLNQGVIYFYNNFRWAKSCEFDYLSQRHNIDSGKWFGATPLGIEFRFDFEEGEHVMTSNDEHYIDTEPLFEQEFNAHADEFSLDITANFKDGVSVTKTLKFSCENTSDRGLLLYAKEA